jgi:hypothetical protein
MAYGHMGIEGVGIDVESYLDSFTISSLSVPSSWVITALYECMRVVG